MEINTETLHPKRESDFHLLESNMLEDLIDHFLIFDESLALKDTYNRLVEVLRYPPELSPAGS